MNRIKHIFCLLFSLFALNSYSQIATDVNLWSGFNLQFKLNKKLTFNIAPEMDYLTKIEE